MTNKEFVEFYSRQVKIGPELSQKLVDEFLRVLRTAVLLNEEVPLKGIMKIKKIEQKSREYRNPRTGEKILKPKRKTVKAIFSEPFKRKVIMHESLQDGYF